VNLILVNNSSSLRGWNRNFLIFLIL